MVFPYLNWSDRLLVMEAEKVLALEVDRVRSSILLLRVWSHFYEVWVMVVVRSPETSCSVTEALCWTGLGWVDCAECRVSSAVVVTKLTFFNFC